MTFSWSFVNLNLGQSCSNLQTFLIYNEINVTSWYRSCKFYYTNSNRLFTKWSSYRINEVENLKEISLTISNFPDPSYHCHLNPIRFPIYLPNVFGPYHIDVAIAGHSGNTMINWCSMWGPLPIPPHLVCFLPISLSVSPDSKCFICLSESVRATTTQLCHFTFVLIFHL